MTRSRSSRHTRRVPWAAAAAAALSTMVATAGAASAQRVMVELRGGASVGNYSETAAGLEWSPGPSFAIEGQMSVAPSVGVYAGFTRSAFGCEEGFCTGQDATLTMQGLTAGARWEPGVPWVRAGVAWQALDLDAANGSADGDAGFGFDLGAGVQIGLGRTFVIRPGVTYRRVPTAIDADDGSVALLALEIGVAAPVPGLDF